MAVMATEEPQSLPVVQKSTDSVPSEEKVGDESSVNGHSEDKTKVDEKPTTNGKAELTESTADDSLNKKAFATNGNLPEQSTDVPLSSTDVEMADVNGTSTVKNSSPTETEAAKEDNADPSTSDKPLATEESAAVDPVVENIGDSMDVDTPTRQPDEEVKVDQENGAQDKPTAGNTAEPTSSQDLSQPSASLAKLDIKAAQSDASVAQVDTPMTDQPTSAGKVSREREEDGMEERAPKRAKTEEDTNGPTADSLVVANSLSSAPTPGEPADQTPDEQVITPFQNRQIRQILAGLKKTKNGLNFRQPVERLWPTLWEDYKTKIENPVDISLFEQKLREEKYANYGAFKADVRLLHQNSLAFNGDANAITVAAGMVRDAIFMRLPEISKLEEPAKPEKGKAHPTRHTEPRAATQPRRQSQSQPRPEAASPKPRRPSPAQPTQSIPSSSAPAFAIPPNGIPQIRRDSTREDSDRPKRPIHPPKNRDLDYAAANRKKLEPEQRFFEVALEEIKKGKHYALNQWFLTPVDPVALNIPTYFSVVKKPMDLATMTQKNYEGEYKNVKDIEKDMRLIVHNAELFNGPSHDVTTLAKRLEDLFKAELGKREVWMKRHYPPEQPSTTNASAPSPERSTHESEEESEADNDDDEGNEAFRTLQTRLDEEQDKLNAMVGSKKPDITMIEIQQQMVSMLQRRLVEEKTKVISGEKKPKPKKKATKSKPKSGAGGSSAANKKAAAGNSTAGKKTSGNSSHKKAAPKSRPVGALEKAVIAEGINELDGATLTRAVEIIKRDTGQNENDDGEMELDIDALSTDALRKLYDLINKTAPSVRTSIERRPEFSRPAEPEPKAKANAPAKPKKNKPMNKHEQERKIEQLRELKAQLQRGGSGSQEPLPNEVEDSRPAESSEEESDSEEE
ncbi:Bromodomain-containing protein [Annulohypoxylon maeteangense]|uniref:Bromodomain-containing protein n=1 Tax=Annulohypoxylon maeteangense TaxID=1927788 RepID=UPI0020089A09|nr:Bromodomain-containing protein [Annulohypoxylon maeteangense]KAI0884897.1 Bromodomain-containing protein [Annulohypoxylon maeteangense]